MKKELKDRVYILKGNSAPLSFMLASRHTRKYPLLHFDTDTNVNRELRYARNQKSPFVDEQDDNAIVEPIVFEDGILNVRKENTILQWFLDLHPGNGSKFMEKDLTVEATSELKELNLEVDALIAAKDLDIDTMEMIARVGLGQDTDLLSSAELKRDVLLYARNYPEDFLELLSNSSLKLQDFSKKVVKVGLVSLRNKNREIFYNLKNNKKKLVNVPFGEEPVSVLCDFFQSDDGLEAYELLKKKIED
tara:strand:- start:4224 stop:4967 length:744 start_codon:yes stop_codon:yes gene_type:complete